MGRNENSSEELQVFVAVNGSPADRGWIDFGSWSKVWGDHQRWKGEQTCRSKSLSNSLLRVFRGVGYTKEGLGRVEESTGVLGGPQLSDCGGSLSKK